MALYSKSIQEPAAKDDGIRICIMRKPKDTSPWDIWMPCLAPSLWLLTNYQQGTITWQDYIKHFTQEVLISNRAQVELLGHMAHHTTITVLCWEETPEKCHRRLVLEAIKKNSPKLPILIR